MAVENRTSCTILMYRTNSESSARSMSIFCFSYYLIENLHFSKNRLKVISGGNLRIVSKTFTRRLVVVKNNTRANQMIYGFT